MDSWISMGAPIFVGHLDNYPTCLCIKVTLCICDTHEVDTLLQKKLLIYTGGPKKCIHIKNSCKRSV